MSSLVLNQRIWDSAPLVNMQIPANLANQKTTNLLRFQTNIHLRWIQNRGEAIKAIERNKFASTDCKLPQRHKYESEWQGCVYPVMHWRPIG